MWALAIPWSIRQRVMLEIRLQDNANGTHDEARARTLRHAALLRVDTAGTSRIREARRELQFTVGFKISDKNFCTAYIHSSINVSMRACV